MTESDSRKQGNYRVIKARERLDAMREKTLAQESATCDILISREELQSAVGNLRSAFINATRQLELIEKHLALKTLV